MSIDAHCHLDLHPDPAALVKTAIDSKLRIVAVTTTPAAFKVSSTFTDVERGIIPALGMHPEVVGIRPRDIELFAKYLDSVLWVGEIGLDGSKRHQGSWDAQVRVFERVLRECSDVGGRILSVHSRAAVPIVFELLSRYPGAGTPVLHWFSGRPSDVSHGLELGAYFSVNLQMLNTKSGIAIIRNIPLDRLLTESDAPFSQPDSPNDLVGRIRAAESKLAEVFGCSLDHIQSRIGSNFDRLTAKSNGT